MHIRPFRSEDLPELMDITAEAFDGVSIDQSIEGRFGKIDGHGWQFRKTKHVEDDARIQPEGIFVAEDAGQIIGYISTRIDAETGIGHIPNLALQAPYRGKGIGRMLLQLALKRFHDAGITHARIETVAQNAIGARLYRSLGFVEVARQIHYAGDVSEMLSKVDG